MTFDDLKMYGRFAFGLPSFFRTTLSLDDARAIVTQRLEAREQNFLKLLARGIYENPHSPFRVMLQLARCELGDVEKLVRADGLEKTLRALRAAEVYVTFEEFKARTPIVRGGQEIPTAVNAFDNPHLSGAYAVTSGGSSGAGTRVQLELDHIAAIAPMMLVTQAAHDVVGAPMALWYGVPPDPSGLNNILIQARLNNLPRKWFTPYQETETHPALQFRIAPMFLQGMGKVMGLNLPAPEPLRLEEAVTCARWAQTEIAAHGKCVLRTHVSRALRIALAARENKIDLTGLLLFGGGEPPTPAKLQEILASGARYTPTYWMTEIGPLGLGCAQTKNPDDTHLMSDLVALVPIPFQLPETEICVDAFHFTTLFPSAPKLLLNLQSDDFGVVEPRACGCLLHELGYATHVRDIASYRKLTGEGVTLVGSTMISILEKIMPARFGGNALDYQLLQAEDEKGFTRLYVMVHPRLQIADENMILETLWSALKSSGGAAEQAGALWRQAQTLQLRREPPRLTAQGKFMPLFVVARQNKPSLEK